jgi:hypothetical protein
MKPRLVLFLLISCLLSSCFLTPNPPPPPAVVTQIVVIPADTATTVPPPPLLPSVTPLPSLTPLPTFTPTSTVTSTPSAPVATLIKNANCRKGPSQSYNEVTSFFAGQVLEIVGRNEGLDNTWWLVKIPNSRSKCWISLVTAQATGNMDDIPIIYPPY